MLFRGRVIPSSVWGKNSCNLFCRSSVHYRLKSHLTTPYPLPGRRPFVLFSCPLFLYSISVRPTRDSISAFAGEERLLLRPFLAEGVPMGETAEAEGGAARGDRG